MHSGLDSCFPGQLAGHPTTAGNTYGLEIWPHEKGEDPQSLKERKSYDPLQYYPVLPTFLSHVSVVS